jgi:hypothetical protein
VRLTALLLLLTTGCYYEPNVGGQVVQGIDAGDPDAAPIIGACDNRDTDPNKPVSFGKDIRPLQTRSPNGCGPCHLRVGGTSGFDQTSYQSLRKGGINSGARIIIAGDPCNSIMYQKLGRTPPFGSRMPFNGPPFWTAEERQLLHDWIAEGALNN